MQQIYLTGKYADEVAAKALEALRVKAAGYRLLPFEVGDGVRGLAMHLLTVPDAPMYNDVPCVVLPAQGEHIVLAEVFDRLAAPALRQAATIHVPMLLGGVCAESLAASEFHAEVCACLASAAQVVAVVADNAMDMVKAMTPAEDQLWLQAADAAYEDVLGRLLQELAMRM